MSKVSDNFIMVFNRIFIKGEGKLSPFELFVYSLLYRCRLEYESGWITSTNMLLLKSMLKCKIDGGRDGKLDNIKRVLLSLQYKGYIFSTVDENTKNDDLVTVMFPTADNEEGFKGFTKIPYTTFDLFDNRDNYYIFAYLESNYNHEHKRHYKNKISLLDWAELLGISKGTVQDRIKGMNTSTSNPRIYKFSGDYNGTERQEENLYFTRIDEKDLFKWNNFYNEDGSPKVNKKKKYLGDDVIHCHFYKDITVDEYKDVIEASAWGKEKEEVWIVGSKYEEIIMEDYFIYRTCKEYNIHPNFIKKCEPIIKAKRNAFNYNHCFEEWERNFKSENVVEIVKEYERLRQLAAKERYQSRNEDVYEGSNPF